MPASDAMIAAREGLEDIVFQFPGVTGIDIGFRDEDVPDPDDLAVRIFVEDESAMPTGLLELVDTMGAPFVVVQRSFGTTGLPDTSRYRPVVGGVSVASERFASTGTVHVGTLGAVARTTTTPTPLTVGLSNHHVLAVDGNRAFGDRMCQPEPSPLGLITSDHIGQLVSWSFPEVVYEGVADAAICTIETDAATEITEIGKVNGTSTATLGMLVQKRGRSTGHTVGIVTNDTTGARLGTYLVNYPHLPPVLDPVHLVMTTQRKMVNQIIIMADFPQSIVFGESGDSGSVVVDFDNNIVGLYYGGGYRTLGDPLRYGTMTPIEVVVQELGLDFT